MENINNDEKRTKLIEQITRAQQLVRTYVDPDISLVDELIAERREEARKELETE